MSGSREVKVKNTWKRQAIFFCLGDFEVLSTPGTPKKPKLKNAFKLNSGQNKLINKNETVGRGSNDAKKINSSFNQSI